ncbi:MAG: hypothetical protein ACI9KE_005218 [Polyangiales bacterium]|jgi:hypothetical protein
MNTKRIAFLTLTDRTGYCIYDALAIPHFAKLGYDVEEVPWDSGADWSQYDAAIIRSTWDYTERSEEFFRTLAVIESSTQLFHNRALVEWNAHKSYLREVRDAGAPLLPTLFGSALQDADLEAAFKTFGCDELVIKPAVSANARGTFRHPRGDSSAQLLEAHAGDYLIQPFAPEVVAEGELSLFYFGGELSHAVMKTPKLGDFRVQEEHGGILKSATPDAEALKAAKLCLAAVPFELLYARVDLVHFDGAWGLMELELIEPSLYFPFDEESPARFARAVHARLTR